MTHTLAFPILSLLLTTMPAAAVLIWLIPDPHKTRWIALVATLADLLLVILLLLNFDSSIAGYQFVEQATWIPSLNIQYMVGVDGLCVLFLPFTIPLFMGVIPVSSNSTCSRLRLYFAMS